MSEDGITWRSLGCPDTVLLERGAQPRHLWQSVFVPQSFALIFCWKAVTHIRWSLRSPLFQGYSVPPLVSFLWDLEQCLPVSQQLSTYIKIPWAFKDCISQAWSHNCHQNYIQIGTIMQPLNHIFQEIIYLFWWWKSMTYFVGTPQLHRWSSD